MLSSNAILTPKLIKRPSMIALPPRYFFPSFTLPLKLLIPSPVFLTTLRGKTSTFLLNNPLSSGEITFGLISSSSPLTRFPLSFPSALIGLVTSELPGLPLFVLPAVTASTPLVLAVALWLAALAEEELRTGRCRNLGAGKFDFLSIASTVRWKRRNKASARMSVLSKSIVVESSLTVYHQLQSSKS
jgi:hypothetical protein